MIAGRPGAPGRSHDFQLSWDRLGLRLLVIVGLALASILQGLLADLLCHRLAGRYRRTPR